MIQVSTGHIVASDFDIDFTTNHVYLFKYAIDLARSLRTNEHSNVAGVEQQANKTWKVWSTQAQGNLQLNLVSNRADFKGIVRLYYRRLTNATPSFVLQQTNGGINIGLLQQHIAPIGEMSYVDFDNNINLQNYFWLRFTGAQGEANAFELVALMIYKSHFELIDTYDFTQADVAYIPPHEVGLTNWYDPTLGNAYRLYGTISHEGVLTAASPLVVDNIDRQESNIIVTDANGYYEFNVSNDKRYDKYRLIAVDRDFVYNDLVRTNVPLERVD